MKPLIFLLALSASACAETFTVLQPHEALRHGDVVSLVAMDSGRWLAAAHGDDTTGMMRVVPQDGGERSVTRWRVEAPAEGVYSFRCLGIGDGPMWMNGMTRLGTVVTSLSPAGVSGAGWGIYREGGGITLKCLGVLAGPRWLAGDARTGAVRLIGEEAAGQSTVWQVRLWSSAPTSKVPRP